jgi:hypothetical protein
VRQVKLLNNGSLELRWTARHPKGSRGVLYFVRRKLEGQRQWTTLGTSASNRFIDKTLPNGAAEARYSIQAQRGDKRSPWDPVRTVPIGAAGAIAGVRSRRGRGGRGGELRPRCRLILMQGRGRVGTLDRG